MLINYVPLTVINCWLSCARNSVGRVIKKRSSPQNANNFHALINLRSLGQKHLPRVTHSSLMLN